MGRIFHDEYLNHLLKIPCRAVSTFWIAHPNNNLINNAAAGSQVNNIQVLFFIIIIVFVCFAFMFINILMYESCITDVT